MEPQLSEDYTLDSLDSYRLDTSFIQLNIIVNNAQTPTH